VIRRAIDGVHLDEMQLSAVAIGRLAEQALLDRALLVAG
jgi:hypothetical protein